MLRRVSLFLLPAVTLALSGPTARAQSTAPDTAEEIVVTATRTGAPVWRVRSATGTLVLVGSIDDVATGTNWRPAALAETVRRADRVMFPQVVGVALSPFSAINYYAKWKRRARLPNGLTLSNMMSAAEVDRLRRLAAQGLAPADFHNLHPLHLAFNMQDRLRKRTGLMEGPSTTVSRAAAKFKVDRIPIRRATARPLADSLFKSQPAEHLPCLRATIAAAEDGPGGLRARSHNWAGKRVQAALKAPAQRMGSSCWPVNTGAIDMPNLTGTARTMIGTPGTTLAVVSLDTLARPNGLLAALRAGGYQVDGPAWR